MADWIRMRSSLLTNPRVVKMARVLLAEQRFMDWFRPGAAPVTRDVTRDERDEQRDISAVTRIVVGTLLPVWSMGNEAAGRDGVIRHATSRDIDLTAGVPGFAKALEAVDWLEVLPNDAGVRFINFEEHNSPQKERALTSKTGADRQREYRERKKREAEEAPKRDAPSDGQRDVTVTSHSDGREEKSREEKKNSLSSSAKLPTCPTDRLVALYHELLPELPQVRLTTDSRKRALQKTWAWCLTSHKADGTKRAETAEQALAWFREYFERTRQNDFLMGRTPRSGEHANWRCDLDFLLTERGMKHVIEKTLEPA